MIALAHPFARSGNLMLGDTGDVSRDPGPGEDWEPVAHIEDEPACDRLTAREWSSWVDLQTAWRDADDRHSY